MTAAADACSIVVGSGALPETGAGGALGVLVALGLVAIVAGTMLRRRGAAPVLGATLLAGLVVLTPAPPATAAPSCTLLTITGVSINAEGASRVLPGDQVELLTATVTNPSDRPITVTARLELESGSTLTGALTADLTAKTSISGPAHGLETPVAEIASGETFTTSAAVTLGDTDNTVQGVEAVARLTLTAMERP